jgi:hypothetical protein
VVTSSGNVVRMVVGRSAVPDERRGGRGWCAHATGGKRQSNKGEKKGGGTAALVSILNLMHGGGGHAGGVA